MTVWAFLFAAIVPRSEYYLAIVFSQRDRALLCGVTHCDVLFAVLVPRFNVEQQNPFNLGGIGWIGECLQPRLINVGKAGCSPQLDSTSTRIVD